MGFIMIRQPFVSVDTLRTLALLHKIADAWGVPESGNPSAGICSERRLMNGLQSNGVTPGRRIVQLWSEGNAWKPYFYGEGVVI